MTTTTTNLYDVLSVSREATTDEIKRAYKKRAREFHPDRYSNKSAEEQQLASEKMKEVTHAAAVLSDEKKRSMYDMTGDTTGDTNVSDDAALNEEMFEAMFGVGADSAAAKKPTGMMGGTMFVNARGEFFQRSYLDVETLRREAKDDSVPIIAEADGHLRSYGVSTSVPTGPWELHVIEADEDAHTVTLTFRAGEWETEPGWNAVRGDLRLTRTFELPPDADVMRVDETAVKMSGGGLLELNVPRRLSDASKSKCASGECGQPAEVGKDEVVPELSAVLKEEPSAFVIGAAPGEDAALAKGRRRSKAKAAVKRASPVSVVEAECKENTAQEANGAQQMGEGVMAIGAEC